MLQPARWTWAAVVLACAPPATSSGTGDATSGTSTGIATSSATTDGSSTTHAAPGYAGTSFIDEPDVSGSAIQCDIWGQDCPPGEKCVPWGPLSKEPWRGTACVLVVDEPRQPGEPCMPLAPPAIDDCADGSFCWGGGGDALGTCVSICEGSESNPSCTNPCEFCNIVSDSSVLAFCLPGCDPLGADCREAWSCVPYGEAFICLADASGDLGAPGDPCDLITSCDPGSFCADAERVPACAAQSCCAPYCDAAAADDCHARLPGTTCVPWYQPGDYPQACVGPGIVGACVLMQ